MHTSLECLPSFRLLVARFGQTHMPWHIHPKRYSFLSYFGHVLRILRSSSGSCTWFGLCHSYVGGHPSLARVFKYFLGGHNHPLAHLPRAQLS